MDTRIKSYLDLTKEELYDLLALRIEVFVIEQNCPYQDLDGVDIVAMKDYVSSRSADSGGAPLIRYTPDPRNGIDYLAGIFLIKKPNGINDYYEIDGLKKAGKRMREEYNQK